MGTTVLALRTVLSLVVVVGLVVVLARVLDDRAAGRSEDGFLSRLTKPFRSLLPGGAGAPRRRRPAAVLTLVGRQGLGPKASVAVVDVGDQRLVLGVSEAGVTLLTSMEAPEPEPQTEPLPATSGRPAEDAARSVREVQAVQTAQVAPPADFADVLAGFVVPGPDGSTVEHPTSAVLSVDGALLQEAVGTRSAGETASGAPGLVAGSILSPATWRQAATAVQSRNRR